MSDAKRLKKTRKNKGLSLMQLAKKAGWSVQHIWKLEHDEFTKEVSVDIKIRVADALDTAFYNLFRDDVESLTREKERIDRVLGKK